MFLIAGGTGFGAVAAVLGGVFRLTDGRHRLRLDRLAAPQAILRRYCITRRGRTMGGGRRPD